MAENSLYPAFVRINYHSPYGVHTMTIPTLGWDYSGGTPLGGIFAAWDASDREAVDMISDFVNLIKPFFLATTTFDNFTIYTMASAEADPTPVFAGELAIDGTSVETEWAKAVQMTWTFRTSLFGIFKLVFLDVPSASGFDKILSFGASPEAEAVRDYLAADTNGFAGRDGGQVSVLDQISFTLNEKLRREYHMN